MISSCSRIFRITGRVREPNRRFVEGVKCLPILLSREFSRFRSRGSFSLALACCSKRLVARLEFSDTKRAARPCVSRLVLREPRFPVRSRRKGPFDSSPPSERFGMVSLRIFLQKLGCVAFSRGMTDQNDLTARGYSLNMPLSGRSF